MLSRSHESESVPPPETSLPWEIDLLEAGRRVTGPAIGLIVCSLLGLFYCCAFEVWAIVFNGDDMRRTLTAQPVYSVLVIGMPALAAAIYAAMLFGSVQMLRRKSYPWAKAASILALIPSSMIAFLSIGFGIWGLLVLRDKRVKAAFGRGP